MPLSPQRQRERRQQIKRLADPPKTRRKRCKNDGVFFTIDPRYPWKEFCKDECRKEYHRHGSAFGPMKAAMEKLVRGWIKETDKRLAALDKRLVEIERALPADVFRESLPTSPEAKAK